jgi:hypothetical protein
MSNVMLVVPEPMNLRGLESFSALLAALREKNYGALIRYCRIRDAAPKLGVMVCSPKGQGLFCQIPYKEDIRDYSFSVVDPLLYNDKAPLIPEKHLRPDGTRKKLKLDNRQVSSTEAKAALANFVDSMSLAGIISTEDESKDAYQPKEVFNPLAQRLGTWLQHRVLHPGDKQFPETDAAVMQGITPLPGLLEKAEKSIQAVKSAFEIKKGALDFVKFVLVLIFQTVPVKTKGPARNNAAKTTAILQASDDEGGLTE